jgi:hypothetical protein
VDTYCATHKNNFSLMPKATSRAGGLPQPTLPTVA